uniref:Zinc metalloproteinase n=1 Tax=Parastrongyloides trichosuri TaxID=131310 RepID=A0A0N4Z5E1_PARTI
MKYLIIVYNFFTFLIIVIFANRVSQNQLYLLIFIKKNGTIRIRRAMSTIMPFRWQNPIPYYVERPVNERLVDKALKRIEEKTCIRFRKTRYFQNGGIVYVRGEGCQSLIGKYSNRKPQTIEIGYDCEILGIIQHETFHALGVTHEFTRPDRNQFIKLFPRNMDRMLLMSPTFNIDSPNSLSTYGLRYDFGSLMHYGRFAGTSNGENTIETKNPNYLYTIGQVSEIGFNDAKLVNLHYCSHICKRKLNCYNGGYTDPLDCSRCRCPRFYTGTLCGTLMESDSSCGDTKLIATNEVQTFTIHGIKNCYIQIKAPFGSKIKVIVAKTKFRTLQICHPGYGLEVKFLGDKSVSGAVLCGNIISAKFTSINNIITMRYVGKESFNMAQIRYNVI